MAQNKKKYVFAQRDVDDFSCIKIVEDGPYKDIIYTYEKTLLLDYLINQQ